MPQTKKPTENLRTAEYVAMLLAEAEPIGLTSTQIQQTVAKRNGMEGSRSYGSMTYTSKTACRCAGVYWDKAEGAKHWRLTPEGWTLHREGKKVSQARRKEIRRKLAEELKKAWEAKRPERDAKRDKFHAMIRKVQSLRDELRQHGYDIICESGFTFEQMLQPTFCGAEPRFKLVGGFD